MESRKYGKEKDNEGTIAKMSNVQAALFQPTSTLLDSRKRASPIRMLFIGPPNPPGEWDSNKHTPNSIGIRTVKKKKPTPPPKKNQKQTNKQKKQRYLTWKDDSVVNYTGC